MLAGAGGSALGQARGAGAFDGTWLVLFTCSASRDGAAGYTWRFLASVRNGVLHGERGVQGQADSAVWDGQIVADGTAELFVHGLTGAPDYSVGRVAPAYPFQFHVRSRFEGARGTGTRVELRSCEAVYSKQ